MVTYASILAWEIPWTEEPSGVQVHGVTKTQTRLSNEAHTPSEFLKTSEVTQHIFRNLRQRDANDLQKWYNLKTIKWFLFSGPGAVPI